MRSPPITASLAAGLLSLALALPGCATGPQRSSGGRQAPADSWRLLETAHYRIRSNLPGEEASRFVARIEALHAAIAASLGVSSPAKARRDVIAVATDRDWRQYFDRTTFASINPMLGEPLIAVNASRGFYSKTPPYSVNHALARELLDDGFPRRPRWFAIGMASHLETVSIDPGGATATVGARNERRLIFLRGLKVHPLAELWLWRAGGVPRGPDQSAYDELHAYSSSYLWVAYLLTAHTARFDDFMARLRKGEWARPAWEAAFRGIDARALEEGMGQFQKFGNLTLTRKDLPQREVPYTERPMSAADAAVTRAELALLGNAKEEQAAEAAARKLLAGAFAADPAHVRATILAGVFESDVARQVSALRKAVAANPADPQGHLWLARRLGRLEGGAQERLAALRRAVELAPDLADARDELARAELEDGRAKEAYAHARRAVELAPSDPSLLETWALVLLATDDCRGALEAQLRAVDLLPEAASEDVRARYLKALDSYRIQCGRPGDPEPRHDG